MSEINVDHIAVASNTEKDADKFFIELLGLKKIKSFNVSADLMKKFFCVRKEQKVIRYEKGPLSFEVFITDDQSQASDTFTHSCLLIKNRDEFNDRAFSMGFETIKVPRKDGNGYYFFVKDSFQNLYEIKKNELLFS
jgi:hypothetical protein